MIGQFGERAERQRGSLLGLAWGDVLGCPVEYWSKQAIAEAYGRYDALPDEYPWARIPREPYYWGHLRPLGLHSDDTQQAVALLHACLAPGEFHVEAITETSFVSRKDAKGKMRPAKVSMTTTVEVSGRIWAYRPKASESAPKHKGKK